MKSEIPYNQAKQIADQVVAMLSLFCDKIFIAGSIRRMKPIIGDVEIVCLPKTIEVTEGDLFDVMVTKVTDPLFEYAVKSLGKTVKGKYDGKYMQIELHQGINLDLFMPNHYDFFRQLAIRTGSGDYSQKVIAGGWRKIGWCGSDGGLRRIEDCEETKTPDGKSKWKCIAKNAQCPPHWQSEQEFFEWIKVPYVEPQFRNI